MKDTVGAGDCFVGTFAYLLADYIDSTSKPIDFSTLCTFVQRSCYASSYSVQFSGGFDKYPTEIIEEWNSSYILSCPELHGKKIIAVANLTMSSDYYNGEDEFESKGVFWLFL